ncbi:MAG TPA: DUF979 domain-containing protein [Candidatus Didemnitutus sp.]|nr:DUF979 domain-containing protein [Candidatus Didemnitutus sp.]
MTLLPLEVFYALIGAIFVGVAIRVALDPSHPRRRGSTAFWGLLGVITLGGKVLPASLVGYGLVILVVLAAARQVVPGREGSTSPEERARRAERLRNRLFGSALLVPGVAIVGALTLGRIQTGDFRLVDPKQAALIALGLGAVIATVAAWRMTGDRAVASVHEGGRLLQAIGWALILPQLLAALGGIFSAAGVDREVAGLVGSWLPVQYPFVASAAYCIGMALFTMCMGNAFAAFAAITGGAGLPFVVQMHHGNPAILGAVGMLSGYCGTLMTPMAANFNIVPAMLLELKDRNAVIKAQVPIGLAILTANVFIMYLTVYRF